MKREDFIGPPCSCGACRQAGVSGLDQRRDPQTGKWLHGYDLKRWYEAKADVGKRFKAMTESKRMR